MSVVQRQILASTLLAFIVLVMTSITYLGKFPVYNWSLLWEIQMIDIPIIISLPLLSIIIGIVFGIASGNFWRKQLQEIDNGLMQLENGQPLEESNGVKTREMIQLSNRMTKVQKHITQQTKLSQKLANEKAEEQEKRIQEIVSQERNRLARELHDSVSQQLFAASMLMSAYNETQSSKDPASQKQLKMVEAMIQQSQLEMRALLLHLRPVALKGKSLQEGMKELLVELTQKVPMEIQWKLEDMSLDKGIEDHLFRILQESVSNTLRHSKASSLEILLIQRDSLVIMRIVDDGVGFSVEEAKTGSYGLQNMEERALEIGGSLKIISVPDKGTRLEVKVPIVKSVGEKND
ncbi:NarL family two-component system sensor histidine kinase LiaS [Bacillus pakistanensis]|uniref:Sensor histidine kinase n=1 Tax=Rossellomorea pakistanensis TaxID=992288 RepID=A0ABS2NJ48_9BACI|nr:sensor histidine kinase [Bacillus pakistanensis]MBM7587887.1 NarL family two-component system sensor histidine kinase LiaS [Bacillus pakistanensis]